MTSTSPFITRTGHVGQRGSLLVAEADSGHGPTDAAGTGSRRSRPPTDHSSAVKGAGASRRAGHAISDAILLLLAGTIGRVELTHEVVAGDGRGQRSRELLAGAERAVSRGLDQERLGQLLQATAVACGGFAQGRRQLRQGRRDRSSTPGEDHRLPEGQVTAHCAPARPPACRWAVTWIRGAGPVAAGAHRLQRRHGGPQVGNAVLGSVARGWVGRGHDAVEDHRAHRSGMAGQRRPGPHSCRRRARARSSGPRPSAVRTASMSSAVDAVS